MQQSLDLFLKIIIEATWLIVLAFIFITYEVTIPLLSQKWYPKLSTSILKSLLVCPVWRPGWKPVL